MLQQLKRKWKVNNKQLFVIISVFALTGSLTAYLSRNIPAWIGFNELTFWLWKVLLSTAVLIFGYQVILLTVSFVFGQFAFFWHYEKKILTAMKLMSDKENVPSGELKQTTPSLQTKNIVIFASGAGSNAQKIIDYFRGSTHIRISLIICNKPGAGVLNIAQKESIPTLLIEKERFFRGDSYLPELAQAQAHLIVLAGFLWKVPQKLIEAYPRRIINIHPALLPKFGGKGMYGQYVHESVLNAGEVETGITIHYVDEHYDNGDIIFQTACPVLEGDTPETLAKRIHQLEYLYYPKVIEKILE
jgi:formyltetrahydrofolate-dependent phosphoribosylglycinamide formyltransferase